MKILVIKLGALGDVVMATPLIGAIQAAHKDAALWLLTTPAFAPIFESWEGLRTVAFPRKGLKQLLATVAWIRAHSFDRVYDLQGNDRTLVLCALSGIAERVGNRTHFPYTCHPAEKWSGQCHIFDRMNDVLVSAGVKPAAPRPALPVTEDDRRYVQRWIVEHRLEAGQFVLAHAGASPRWPTKVWPFFGELGTRLEQHGIRVIWVGEKPDSTGNHALAKHAGLDATGAFSVCALAELGRSARFAVTNDSGPMHILSCSGIPVFALFGPSNWRRNHAIGQAQRVFSCVDFDPKLSGHPSGDCLSRIPCDAVWKRLADERLV